MNQPPNAQAPGTRWRHKKRGSTYVEIGRGTMRVGADTSLVDDEPVVIYRSEDTGDIWCRPVAEFDDGRFEPPECSEAGEWHCPYCDSDVHLSGPPPTRLSPEDTDIRTVVLEELAGVDMQVTDMDVAVAERIAARLSSLSAKGETGR